MSQLYEHGDVYVMIEWKKKQTYGKPSVQLFFKHSFEFLMQVWKVQTGFKRKYAQ